MKKILQTKPDLIILDIELPGIKGTNFLQFIKHKEELKDICVIMVSGITDIEIILDSFRKGAVDYLKKPFDEDELILRIRVHIENIFFRKNKEEEENNLNIKITEKSNEINDIKDATIFSLAKLAESRDPETGNHLERIREYAKLLSEELEKEEKYGYLINKGFIKNIYNMSVLHDIGKVGIGDSILLKPDKLTKDEFEIMKNHTLIGGDALKETCYLNRNANFLSMGRDIAFYHHERWNGKGYPFSLKGEEIPIAARIVAIADVYDAISFKRVYREKPFSDSQIYEIMNSECGNIFDPNIFKVFIRIENKFKEIKETFKSSYKF